MYGSARPERTNQSSRKQYVVVVGFHSSYHRTWQVRHLKYTYKLFYRHSSPTVVKPSGCPGCETLLGTGILCRKPGAFRFLSIHNTERKRGGANSAGSTIVNPGKFLASAVGSLPQPLFARGQLTEQLKIASQGPAGRSSAQFPAGTFASRNRGEQRLDTISDGA